MDGDRAPDLRPDDGELGGVVRLRGASLRSGGPPPVLGRRLFRGDVGPDDNRFDGVRRPRRHAEGAAPLARAAAMARRHRHHRYGGGGLALPRRRRDAAVPQRILRPHRQGAAPHGAHRRRDRRRLRRPDRPVGLPALGRRHGPLRRAVPRHDHHRHGRLFDARRLHRPFRRRRGRGRRHCRDDRRFAALHALSGGAARRRSRPVRRQPGALVPRRRRRGVAVPRRLALAARRCAGCGGAAARRLQHRRRHDGHRLQHRRLQRMGRAGGRRAVFPDVRRRLHRRHNGRHQDIPLSGAVFDRPRRNGAACAAPPGLPRALRGQTRVGGDDGRGPRVLLPLLRRLRRGVAGSGGARARFHHQRFGRGDGHRQCRPRPRRGDRPRRQFFRPR